MFSDIIFFSLVGKTLNLYKEDFLVANVKKRMQDFSNFDFQLNSSVQIFSELIFLDQRFEHHRFVLRQIDKMNFVMG